MKSLKVWWFYTKNSFQKVIVNRTLIPIFVTGKALRILLFLAFLGFLFKGANNLAGYSREQIIFFYLTFNLISTLSQFLFRETYYFRQLVVTGNFDMVLVKPINPLIRVLLGGADVLDFIMLFLIFSLTGYYGLQHISAGIFPWMTYLFLVINALLISAALHIFVLGLAIITLSVDQIIMIYRDIESMLRIPVDVYTEPIRALLTFIIPLGIMLTFPAKALMGLLSAGYIIFSFSLSFILLFLALRFWLFSLRRYQSASS